MTAPQVPTNLVPANGSTVTTSNFAVSARLLPWPNRQKLQFQIASNSGFTVGVRTVETDWRNPGAATAFAGLPRIAQGSVWVRVRAVEEGSNDASAWSAAAQLTVSHPGNARLLRPGRNEALPWNAGSVTFEWDFADTCEYDTQTAYRVRVQTDNSDSTYDVIEDVYASYGSILALNTDYADLMSSGGSSTLYDSGKITSPNESRVVTIPAGGRNEVLRWSVETWDNDDASAGVTSYHPFFVGDSPVVTIVSPTTTVTTPSPTIDWTYASAAGHTQQSFRVRFFRSDNGQEFFDSGPQVGSVTAYTPPSGVLTNGLEFEAVVYAVSSLGVMSTDSVALTAQWVAPPGPSFSIDRQWYADFNQVDLDWAGAPRDATFVEWRVYRRFDSDHSWEFLGSTTVDQWMDHSAAAGDDVQYAVTQVGVAFGVQVESPLYPVSVDLSVTTYLLKAVNDPTLVLELRNVTADDFAHQYESEVLDVMDVGRKAEVGTSLGRSGTLSVQLRDLGVAGAAGDAYRRLVDIQESKQAVIMRVPFRESLLVHLGDISVTRIAGVVTELSDVSIPYTEITQ
jgi:hypothetical protein